MASKKKAVKKAAKKSTVKRAPVKPWSVDIEVNLEKYSAKGITSLEALTEAVAKIPKGMLKTSTLIRLSGKKTSAQQIFYSLQVRRMILSHTVREIWAKRLESMQKKSSK